MKVYLEGIKSGIKAVGMYNVETKELIVLKGSVVSETVSFSETFRGISRIVKKRQENVTDRIVMKNVLFKSSSTAANFITGCSTNGLTAWKTELGLKLREVIK
ncbi:MAG: DUF4357 domain-containing protein [Bacillota bacterium]